MKKYFIRYVRKLHKKYSIWHCPKGVYLKDYDKTLCANKDVHVLMKNNFPIEIASSSNSNCKTFILLSYSVTRSIWYHSILGNEIDFLKERISELVRDKVESKWWYKKGKELPSKKVYPKYLAD